MTILGVTLRASPNRPSTTVSIDGQLGQPRLTTFMGDIELYGLVEIIQPRVIAVGAPMTLPAGLCCLEESCECDFYQPQAKGRQFELELSKMGVGCFFTNKRTIIRDLIYRGVELKRRLTKMGFEVIEVYPYATKLILFGDQAPRRVVSGSLSFHKEKLPELIPDLAPCVDKLDRPSCDAAFNAYTGYLYSKNGTDSLGDPSEGTLIVPKLPR